jgi:hypothetical protein
MPDVGNIKVGKPDTTPDKPAHTPGVREGNKPGSTRREPGITTAGHGRGGRGTARRSTGINPGPRNPIDSRMPNLSPP